MPLLENSVPKMKLSKSAPWQHCTARLVVLFLLKEKTNEVSLTEVEAELASSVTSVSGSLVTLLRGTRWPLLL